MKNNLAKVYAAFKVGLHGVNLLETYFLFTANILYESSSNYVDEKLVKDGFLNKYNIILPNTFIRQILGIGIRNQTINRNHGRYIINRPKLLDYKLNSDEFESKWFHLLSNFSQFLNTQDIYLEHSKIEEFVLGELDKNDEKIILFDPELSNEKYGSIEFYWCKYIQMLSEKVSSDFDFIVSLSLSNVLKQAVFINLDGGKTFNGLNIYLDSPMVFALLGMDSEEREISYKFLLKKMKEVGCIVSIFDHNLNEIIGIVNNSIYWVTSSLFDLSKANNAMLYFINKHMQKSEMDEFCVSIPDKIKKLGIIIKPTDYAILDNTFQEDEKMLADMIEDKYKERLPLITEERKISINIDVRSIIMIYRERKGLLPVTIQESNSLLLTTNSTVANISKSYAVQISVESSHIPACISVDLFGTVLWLFSPADIMEYKRKQLLADCFISLRPSKKLLSKYVESLKEAYDNGDIDEKKYQFLRTHSIVSDALINVTRGDDENFNSQTYIEVYNEIEEIANRKYQTELEKKVILENELKSTKENFLHILNEKQVIEEELLSRKNADERRLTERKHRNSNILAWILTGVLFAIPYAFFCLWIDLSKLNITEVSKVTIIFYLVFIITSLIVNFTIRKAYTMIYNAIQKRYNTIFRIKN